MRQPTKIYENSTIIRADAPYKLLNTLRLLRSSLRTNSPRVRQPAKNYETFNNYSS